MIRLPYVKIRINGHTDNEGTDDYNYKLSKERARAIFLWLINNGIDQFRISYKGHGSEKPLMDSSSDINKEINRRVEFEIIEN
jgi:OmpA-OmpF porin, OOP family